MEREAKKKTTITTTIVVSMSVHEILTGLGLPIESSMLVNGGEVVEDWRAVEFVYEKTETTEESL